jgi:ribosomal protein S18 acetylase RimI-like enzyme
MAIRIDRLVPADIPAIAVLEPGLFPGEEWPMAEYRRALGSRAVTALALRQNGELIGYGLVRRVTPEVHSIDSAGVRADHQGRSLGLALLTTEIDVAIAQGARTLELEVAVTKPAIIALYERLGFRIRQTLRGYYAPGDDAFAMVTDDVRSGSMRERLDTAHARIAVLGLEVAADLLAPAGRRLAV